MIEYQGMLAFIRHHRNIFMIIFVVCAVGLMVSMGLPSGSRRSASGGGFADMFSFGSREVAKVGNQEVSKQELEQDIFRREEQFRKMFASQLNTEQGKKMYEQIRKSQLNADRILDELIQRKIFYNLFEERGLQIAAGAVKNQIEQLPYFKTNGAFDPSLYKKLVTSPHDFENNLRDQLKGEKVMEPFAFTASVFAPASAGSFAAASSPAGFSSGLAASDSRIRCEGLTAMTLYCFSSSRTISHLLPGPPPSAIARASVSRTPTVSRCFWDTVRRDRVSSYSIGRPLPKNGMTSSSFGLCRNAPMNTSATG